MLHNFGGTTSLYGTLDAVNEVMSCIISSCMNTSTNAVFESYFCLVEE